MNYYKIAITGEFRRGKDTLADLIADKLDNNVTRLAFAAALKEEIMEMVDGYAGVVDRPFDRDVMGPGWQWWGQFRRLLYGEDYWIKELDKRYRHTTGVIIITDMRHHNEAKWCRDNGFYLIRIEGPCRAEDEQRDPNHPSERHVKDLDVHLVIHNVNGLDYLKSLVKAQLMPKLREFFDAPIPAQSF